LLLITWAIAVGIIHDSQPSRDRTFSTDNNFYEKVLSIFLFLVFWAAICAGQIFKTSLKLTVRNGPGNTAESASVKLFETKEDFLKEKI